MPVEEGGLEIWDLLEVQTSLLMKFGWKIIQGNSLWSNFFSAKYVGDAHISSIMNLGRGSRFWKGIMRIMPMVLANSRWILCSGNNSFWLDN